MSKITEFKRWRQRVGVTQAQAAGLLHVSESQVVNWDTGVDRGRGTPMVPPYAVRVLMRVIADGTEIKPWPE
jgi:DNA-binding transcriptional regulator YiaG